MGIINSTSIFFTSFLLFIIHFTDSYHSFTRQSRDHYATITDVTVPSFSRVFTLLLRLRLTGYRLTPLVRIHTPLIGGVCSTNGLR